MPRDPKFVDAYSRRTGRKQRVPRKWLALYPDLIETPSARRDAEAVVPAEQVAPIAGGGEALARINAASTAEPVDPQTPPSAAEDPVPDSGPAAHQED